MKILIFGGSFDPVHRGHLHTADKVQRALGFDEVWFVPCQASRYGKEMSRYTHRLDMLQSSLIDYDNHTFRVSAAEIECDAQGKMYDLAIYLRDTYPEHEFQFLIGSDSSDKINTWYRAEELTAEFKFVIVPRGEDSTSSTEVRKHIRQFGSSIMVTDGVNKIIKERGLYV